MGPAPTIPSAPMSPAESEIFDELQFGNSSAAGPAWCSSPGRWAVNYRPASAASRHYHQREPRTCIVAGGGAYYYSSSGLDGIGFGTRPMDRRTPTPFLPGGIHNYRRTEPGSFASNVKGIANAYRFDEGAERNGDADDGIIERMGRQENRVFVTPAKDDFTHLIYPP